MLRNCTKCSFHIVFTAFIKCGMMKIIQYLWRPKKQFAGLFPKYLLGCEKWMYSSKTTEWVSRNPISKKWTTLLKAEPWPNQWKCVRSFGRDTKGRVESLHWIVHHPWGCCWLYFLKPPVPVSRPCKAVAKVKRFFVPVYRPKALMEQGMRLI